MKIVIAGASGFIGKYISQQFLLQGDDVVHISRHSITNNWTPEHLLTTINGADVLINLAGKNINCRLNKKNKEEIINSRLSSTRLLSDAVSNCENPPKVWINASASGLYNHFVPEAHTEDSLLFANDFLSNVVKKLEKMFFFQQHSQTRKVALRFSVVLGKNGGALKPLISLTRLGLGGKQGSGKQIFSWIHLADVFRMVDFIIKSNDIQGVINCTAPLPVTNDYLMKSLRNKLRVKFGLYAPEIFLKIGTFIIGTDSKLVLESTNVIPHRIREYGFNFQFDNIEDAFDDLL